MFRKRMKELCDEVMALSSGPKIVELMSETPEAERRELTRCRLGSRGKQTLFFRVCLYQSLDTVEYFLKSCDPDINERCNYKANDKTETITDVPPLCMAACLGNIELANLLLSYGADINGRSETNSTALRVACREGHIDMVKMLLSRGADLTITNDEGTTCLMSATGNLSLVEYLLEKGADVNAIETGYWRATALHYAVHADNIQLVRTLVQAGADMSVVDKNGHAPFLSAALGCNLDMLEYLLEANKEPAENVIKGYEALGLSQLTEGVKDGRPFLNLANKHKSNLGLYELVSNPITDKFRKFIPLLSLPEDEEALEGLPLEKETLQSLAILISSRHLRADGDYFQYIMAEFATTLRKKQKYEQAFELHCILYNLILDREDWYHDNVAHCLVWCITLIDNILSYNTDDSIQQYFSKIEPLLVQSAMHIRKAYEWQFPPRTKDMRQTFRVLMISFLHLIKIYLKCIENHKRYIEEVNSMVSLNPTVDSDETLLHLLVNFDSFSEGDPIKQVSCKPFMETDVISWLLNHDMEINSLDGYGETPLSTLVYNHLEDSDADNPRNIVALLLNRGAHLDMRSKTGTDPLYYCHAYDIDKIKYLSLKCLAANTVNAHNIPYHDYLPRDLVSFVQLHGFAGDEFS